MESIKNPHGSSSETKVIYARKQVYVLQTIAILRHEMASDLLNLSSSLRSEKDLPEVFQWMANGKQATDKGESPKSRLDMELGKAGLTYRHPPTPKMGTVYSMQWMTS